MSEQQVDRKHYQFEHYGGLDRFSSYWYQLREILAQRPETVLEIGVGDGVVGRYLRHNAPIQYTSVDMAADVKPDVVSNILTLPFANNTFSVVCAFEVLEHLPFDQVAQAVSEMRRVAKSHMVISVPHFGPPIKLLCKLPFLPECRLAYKIPWPKKHQFNGQHYWELGKRGYPVSRLVHLLRQHGTIERQFVPFENQYHHFFIVAK